jgi:hypothetical protein
LSRLGGLWTGVRGAVGIAANGVVGRPGALSYARLGRCSVPANLPAPTILTPAGDESPQETTLFFAGHRGAGPALRTLARRAPIPVEVAVYYVVGEALTNVARHAQASEVFAQIQAQDGGILASVCDDCVGGADPPRGSGLIGLRNRTDALGAR